MSLGKRNKREWMVWTKEATPITRIKISEQKMITRQLPLCECIVVLATVLLKSDCFLSSSTISSFNPDDPGTAACASAGCRISLHFRSSEMRRGERGGRGGGEVGDCVGLPAPVLAAGSAWQVQGSSAVYYNLPRRWKPQWKSW